MQKAKSDKDISYDINFMWNLKKVQITFIQNRNRFTDTEKGIDFPFAYKGKRGD